MKHLAIIIAVVLMATVASATESPIDKGAWVLAGNAYFMSQSGELYENSDGDGVTWFSIAPSVAYFVAPSILIGADISFLTGSQGDNTATEILFGPMVGYYFNMDPARTEVKGAVYPFVKGFFLFGSDKFKSDLFEETNTITQLGGEAGVVFMVSNAVGVNFQGLVTSTKIDYDDDTVDPDILDSESGTSFQIGAGITAFVY